MTVSVGGVALSDHLRLDGVNNQSAMAGSARATMGGVQVQWIPMSAGKKLQLVAVQDGNRVKGPFTGAQVDALVALRDAGEPVELVHHLGTFTVWIPPDGINFEEINGHADPGSSHWYIGTITLITVA